MHLALKGYVQQSLIEIWFLIEFFDQVVYVPFFNFVNDARLNRLYGKGAGDAPRKTFDRRQAFVLKEELYRDILTIIVKPHSCTTLLNEKIFPGDPSFRE